MGFYYAVARGREVGVYNSWSECQEQINRFPNARFKKFNSMGEARDFIAEHSDPGARDFGPIRSSYASHGASSAHSRNRISSPYQLPQGRRSFVGGIRVSHNTNRPTSSETVDNDWDAPVVYTDGACSNNGRYGAKAGYGVYWGDGHRDNCCGAVDGPATNNRGELQAVAVAMQQAINKKMPRLIIRTDSQLLINSMDSWINKWKSNGWRTADGSAVKNVDLLQEIDDKRRRISVRFEHVRGHAGIAGNEAADELARRGAEKY